MDNMVSETNRGPGSSEVYGTASGYGLPVVSGRRMKIILLPSIFGL